MQTKYKILRHKSNTYHINKHMEKKIKNQFNKNAYSSHTLEDIVLG